MSGDAIHFPCTPGGRIAAGRRRLRTILAVVGLTALGVAALAFWVDRTVPALLAAGAGIMALFAGRMSGDLDPIGLDIETDRLVIRMRRQSETLPVRGVAVRRLTGDEIEHLERLATLGGVTAGTGGFDSHLLGELDLYASEFDNAVLIVLGETSAVVTPDQPEAFLEAIGAAGASLVAAPA